MHLRSFRDDNIIESKDRSSSLSSHLLHWARNNNNNTSSYIIRQLHAWSRVHINIFYYVIDKPVSSRIPVRSEKRFAELASSFGKHVRTIVLYFFRNDHLIWRYLTLVEVNSWLSIARKWLRCFYGDLGGADILKMHLHNDGDRISSSMFISLKSI